MTVGAGRTWAASLEFRGVTKRYEFSRLIEPMSGRVLVDGVEARSDELLTLVVLDPSR